MVNSLLKICFSGIPATALLLVVACVSNPAAPKDDNPMHEGGSSYTPPEITYVNIADGDKITDKNVLISWKGNTVTTDYSYQIDSDSWNITSETSVTFHDLEEGPHTFRLEPQNEYYTGEKITRTFIINSLVDPGIYFTPDNLAAPGIVLLYLDGIAQFMGAHIEISASLSCAELGEFTLNNELAGTVQVFTDNPDSSQLIIDCAYLGGKNGLSGTFLLGSFTVNPVNNGEIAVDQETTVFRDVANNDVLVKGLDSVRISE